MAHSLEVRPPFLDHRIIEFAATLPTSLKIRGSEQKYVLRELMKPILTSFITQRAKVGFDIPAHEWFRGTLRNLLLETLDFAEAEYSDLFRFDTIRNLTKLHLNRSISIGYHLWGLMIVFLWMKRWKISSAPLPQSKAQMSTIGL
jgi:asparagine synthase (glutamine-hydrolysing)